MARSTHNENGSATDEIWGLQELIRTCKSGNIWDECGRRGSEWAETLGKCGHGFQEGF